ncbi:MAG TPA: tetratricopeptide repeat protein [Planctomycetota bacterium]|nr:tetratricopeptide repeat protein [Planctomycetota bacterium]
MLRELAPGTVLGRWTLGEKLGQGGMGAVYAATDASGRRVALKVLLERDPQLLARFELEARAAQAVRHENVAETIELFSANGLPVIAMELLPGGSLHDLVKARGALPWPEAATLARGVARGLAAIHARGLVHRDLKPQNVLLDAARRPKITDFGLVRRSPGLAQSEHLTKTGVLLGTYAYMAPEMAERADVDFRADLYSLGALAYELLSGAPPFEGVGLILVKKLLTDAPRSLAARGVPAKLDALVLRLLAKKPEERPETATDVARDLDDILAAKATSTGPPRRVPMAALALGLLAASALGAGGAWLALRAGPAPPSVAPPAPSPPPPSVTWAPAEEKFQDLCARRLGAGRFAKLVGARGHVSMRHASSARIVAFARVEGAKPLLLSVGYVDGLLRFWDPATGAAAREPIAFDEGLRTLSVDARGRRAAVGGVYGYAGVVDLATGARLSERRLEGGQAVVALSEDGKFCVACAGPAALSWAVDGRDEGRTLGLESAPWWGCFYPGSANKVAVGRDDGAIAELDFEQGGAGLVELYDPHPRATIDGAFDSKGRLFSVGAGLLQRQERGQRSRSLRAPDARGRGIAVSPDGRLVATSGDDGRVLLRHAETLEVVREIVVGAGTSPVESVAFAPDSRTLAAGGADGSVRLFGVEDGAERWAPPAAETHGLAITALAVAADGKRVVSGSEDQTFRVWDASGAFLKHLATETPAGIPSGAAFLRDGRVLVMDRSGALEIRSTGTWALEEHTRVGGHPFPYLLALSPDGLHVAVSGHWGMDGRVLRVDQGFRDEGIRIPAESTQKATTAADFSREGDRLALCGYRNEGENLFLVKLTGDPAHGNDGMMGFPGDRRLHPAAVAFLDAPGTQVVLGGPSQTVSILDLEARKAVHQTHVEAFVEGFAVLDPWIAVLAGRRVAILDRQLRPHGAIDLGLLDDRATALARGPDGHELWVGTGTGAILRFRLPPADKAGDECLDQLHEAFRAFGRGDYQASLDAANKALAADASSALALARRAAARELLKDMVGAAQDYGKALELDPGNPDILAAFGALRLAQGDFERAEAVLSRSIALYPWSETVYRDRGLARQARGDLAGARQDLARFLAMAPASNPDRVSVQRHVEEIEKQLAK